MYGFVKMSKYAGMREDLVQAGGGNSSFKIAHDKMVIKASGYQLADINMNEGYAVVNPLIIKDAFLNSDNLEAMTDADSKIVLQHAFIKGERPSIETFLHSISGKYTLHTHPIVVNALACRKGGMEVLRGLFPDALMVPYATPGVELAKAYFNAYKQQNPLGDKTFDVVFLQNHGLVVSADTADEVIRKTEVIVRHLENYLVCDMNAYRNVTKLWGEFPDKIVWRVTDKNVIDAYKKLNCLWIHTFCPDCVVFLGKKAVLLEDNFTSDDITEFIAANGNPVVLIYRRELYLIANSVIKAMEIQSVMSFSAQVMLLNDKYEFEFLTDEEQDFLLDWDAEKYRKNMK